MSSLRNPPEYIPLAQHDRDPEHDHDHDLDHDHLDVPFDFNRNSRTGTNSNASSRRSSASINSASSVSLTGRRWRSRHLVLALLVGAIGAGIWVSSSSSLMGRTGDLGRTGDDVGMGGSSAYRPGRLGRELVRRRRVTLGQSKTEDSENVLEGASSPGSSSTSTSEYKSKAKDLFSLLPHPNRTDSSNGHRQPEDMIELEKPCIGYIEGDEKEYTKRGCWRAIRVGQMEKWEMEDAE